jgi:hypothetical protein
MLYSNEQNTDLQRTLLLLLCVRWNMFTESLPSNGVYTSQYCGMSAESQNSLITRDGHYQWAAQHNGTHDTTSPTSTEERCFLLGTCSGYIWRIEIQTSQSQASTDRGLGYSANGRIFNNMLHTYMIHTLDRRPSIFIRDKPIFSSERMLHKDYDCKDSVEEKILGPKSQEAWNQDEPPVIK